MSMLRPTRAERRALEADNRKFQSRLRRLSEAEIADKQRWSEVPAHITRPVEVWRSREFLLQVFAAPGGFERLTVCRTSHTGKSWVDGISWDDLQRLKNECGRGDKDAFEIFPADRDVVNVANMRHLWVTPTPLPMAWRTA